MIMSAVSIRPVFVLGNLRRVRASRYWMPPMAVPLDDEDEFAMVRSPICSMNA
jgi:hypothetical protein